LIEPSERSFYPRKKVSDRQVPIRPFIFHVGDDAGLRLLEYGKQIIAVAGERILAAEEVPRKAILILKGRASLHPLDTSFSDLFGRSELIGLTETISRRPTYYSVVAESECRIELIDRTKLLLAIENDQHLRHGLILSLGAEVQEIYRLFAFL